MLIVWLMELKTCKQSLVDCCDTCTQNTQKSTRTMLFVVWEVSWRSSLLFFTFHCSPEFINGYVLPCSLAKLHMKQREDYDLWPWWVGHSAISLTLLQDVSQKVGRSEMLVWGLASSCLYFSIWELCVCSGPRIPCSQPLIISVKVT